MVKNSIHALLSAALSSSARQSDVAIQTWKISGPFDDQLQDKFNFGLHDEALAVLISILTGFIMLMLINVIFRVVVRARGAVMSMHMIQRRYLLTTTLSPMRWVSELRRAFAHEPADVHDVTVQSGRHCCFPLFQWLGVVFVAFLLLFAELAVLFAQTSRNTPVFIDKTRMPTFSITDSGRKVLNLNVWDSCRAFPLTNKPRFSSDALFQVCKAVEIDILNETAPANEVFVVVQQRLQRLSAAIMINNSVIRTTPSVQISLGDEMPYRVLTDETPEQALSALNKVFARWGFGFQLIRSSIEVDRRIWRYIFLWKLNPSETMDNNDQFRVLWIMEGLFVINKFNRAIKGSYDSQKFLDEIHKGPLIYLRSPYMNLIVAIALSISLVLIWMVVTFLFGCSYGVDERWGWVTHFSTTRKVGDFGFHNREEVINVQDKNDISEQGTLSNS